MARRITSVFFRCAGTCIVLCLLLTIPVSAMLFPATEPSSPETIDTLTVDCRRVNGTIRSFGEINGGPLAIRHVENGADVTEQYRHLGMSFIRTHDFYGPTDISTIFPDMDADPALPSSYNFTESDRNIKAIVDAGCRVFYRLGESASDNISLCEPPGNVTKWAEICRHIVMHYNDGWNNGYQYNITYWEIWNEPDLQGFWNGTAEQYYRLYNVTARTLKNHNASLNIGGPCTSSIANENYTTGFLDYVTGHDLPLDFYSWHMYADTPHDLYMAARAVRAMLDAYGLHRCENINTEWNINILAPQRDKDNAKNAAFTACTLTAFQDAALDHAFRYRGTGDNGWLARLLGFDLGLFTADGAYKTPALSYLAVHHMARHTPLRLFTSSQDAATGVTALAGIASHRGNISVLVSNHDTPLQEYTVELSNIPWTDGYTVAHYAIDDGSHLEIIDSDTAVSDSHAITISSASNTAHLFWLTNGSTLPAEGPPVATIPWLLRFPILDPLLQLIGILLLTSIFG